MPAMPFEDDCSVALITELEREARRHEVRFEGGRVVWRCFGKGKPLVLLHGGHGSWLHWARNVRALAAHRAVWVPDLPGYGDSAPPPEPTLRSLLDTTHHTLGALVGACTPIDLVGFSFGGLVAAHLALRRGGVSRLALLGPAGHGGTRRPRGGLRSWRQAYEHWDVAALAELMRHNLWVHMLHHPASIEDLALRIHTDACLKARFHSKPISRAGGLGDCLARFCRPVLLAWGEHDVTAEPAQAASLLTGSRNDCSVHVVPNAGHWVQFEAADAVNTLLLRWLEETSDNLQQES
jgi:pimeloyl-ACP methyl ester carboxylesterase